MAERVIEQADLSEIANNLSVIFHELQNIDSGVEDAKRNVQVVETRIDNLEQNFNAFVQYWNRQNEKKIAQSNLIDIRLQLEQQFGQYKTVRNHAIGILQADDLGIVRKETISSASEELMLATPNYWLTPCLVALAAWISNQSELAQKALKEGIRRNDEKTSLFFALVCRRANRKDACLKWTQRYLENQDEESLDRKSIIVLDAYASGLFGVDTEGLISGQIEQWMTRLSEKPGFIEKQTDQWSQAINSKRRTVDSSSYTYLKKYSSTWSSLEDVLEGAYLHSKIFDYFSNIFNQKNSTESLKNQLDEILTNLVTEYDDEELPLKRKEEINQLIIDFDGDKRRAEQMMQAKQSVFETHKDFTQLLTEAAMHPENSHVSVSTQKFAIALSRDWIINAYQDVVAKNRSKIPYEIDLNLENFSDKTTDGTNETELISKFTHLVDSEKEYQLSQNVMSNFDNYCLYGGGAIVAIGVGMLLAGSVFMGLIALIAGIGAVSHHFSMKEKIKMKVQAIEEQFERKLNSGKQIIRAFLAEVVDFRAEFSEKDSESQKVLDYLEQISPEQYIRKLSDSNRRIKI